MKTPRKVTKQDMAAIDLIRKCGFVGIDADGEPWLETNIQITKMRFEPLKAHGLICSNQDGLYPGFEQTFSAV